MLQHLSPELIRTVCRGSNLEIYTQTLQFKDPSTYKKHFVVGKCTCPVRNNCKHCAAALFFLQDPENQASVLAAIDRPQRTTPRAELKPAPPERLIDDLQPRPRLILAS